MFMDLIVERLHCVFECVRVCPKHVCVLTTPFLSPEQT